jgi:hypothetical protein
MTKKVFQTRSPRQLATKTITTTTPMMLELLTISRSG